MELRVGKWGDGLAVRLPQTLVQDMGLYEGERIKVDVLKPGELRLLRQQPDALSREEERLARRQRLLDSIRELHKSIPVTAPVPREELGRY